MDLRELSFGTIVCEAQILFAGAPLARQGREPAAPRMDGT